MSIVNSWLSNQELVDSISTVVVVGACDGLSFDIIGPHIKRNLHWKSFFLEPVRNIYLKLVLNFYHHPNAILINSAISDKNGIKSINTIKEDSYELGAIPSWALGISSFYDNEVTDSLKDHMTKEEVTTITTQKFLDDYNVPPIDILQIDVEGDDYFVFTEFWSRNVRPKIIKVEIKNCTKDQKKSIIDSLTSSNYSWYVDGDDISAIKN
jgi:FkbM family methyltransferase